MFRNLEINISGGSHDAYIEASIKGPLKNIIINEKKIESFLALRRGRRDINTPRVEVDNYEFTSGVINNVITENMIRIKIYNNNIKPKDYQPTYLRQLHADYIMHLKGNYQTGGGIYSARITIVYVILAAILDDYIGESVFGHIKQIKHIKDISIQENDIQSDVFPVIDTSIKEDMLKLIIDNMGKNISLGAKLEFKISNVTPLLGGDLFDSFESYLSANLFAIPGVKGVMFGQFNEYSDSLDVIDSYEINDVISSKKNYNGGINAGYSNGYEDIIFSITMRPTPTTAKIQPIFNINNDTIEIIEKEISGRHDAFIANRAVIVIISMTIITLFDLKGNYGFRNTIDDTKSIKPTI